MTNPCIYIYDSDGHVKLDSEGKRVVDIEATKEYKNRGILTDSEVSNMLGNADKITNEYFRARAKCLIALFKKWGKRRKEIAILKRIDLKVENGLLYVTFTLLKKHKLGLFQYFKFLKKHDPEQLDKTYMELVEDWRVWKETSEGQHTREDKVTKSVALEDKYCKMILEYAELLDNSEYEGEWFFPSGKSIFGAAYILLPGHHLQGWQILHILKPLNLASWCHLFRETKGAEKAKERGRTLDSIFAVKDTLDLESEEAAYHYVKRYGIELAKTEV
jgi:hypothetical protein